MPMVWLDGWQKMGNIKTKRSAVSTPFLIQIRKPIPVWVSVLLGALEGTRTPDLLIRRQALYPAELLALMH